MLTVFVTPRQVGQTQRTETTTQYPTRAVHQVQTSEIALEPTDTVCCATCRLNSMLWERCLAMAFIP